MAFDASDKGRLKAAIPEIFRPPQNAGGALSSQFSAVDATADPVGEIDREGVTDARARHDIGMGFVGLDPDTASPNFALTSSQVSARAAHHIEFDRHKRDDLRFALDQAKAALDARLAALDAELAAIDARLAAIKSRRAEIGTALDAASDIEEIRRSGRKLDPANARDATLLRAAGLKAEDVNGDDYAAVINRLRLGLDTEDGSLETEWNTAMKRRGEVVRARGEILEARGDIEAANSDEARILAQRRAATTLGAQQLGEAAYLSGQQDAKLIAANAVAESEDPARVAASKATTVAAATQTDAFYSKSDALDWDKPASKAGTPKP